MSPWLVQPTVPTRRRGLQLCPLLFQSRLNHTHFQLWFGTDLEMFFKGINLKCTTGHSSNQLPYSFKG